MCVDGNILLSWYPVKAYLHSNSINTSSMFRYLFRHTGKHMHTFWGVFKLKWMSEWESQYTRCPTLGPGLHVKSTTRPTRPIFRAVSKDAGSLMAFDFVGWKAYTQLHQDPRLKSEKTSNHTIMHRHSFARWQLNWTGLLLNQLYQQQIGVSAGAAVFLL